jgi:hypothetical protein
VDISKIKPVERIVDILHPSTKEPIGLQVSVVSLDDPTLLSVKRRINDERIKAEARGKTVTTEEALKNEYELVFASMTGWVWAKDSDYGGVK